MKSMRNMLVLLAIGALAAGGAFGDYASLVNVNFRNDMDADEDMIGAAAIGAAGDQWNSILGSANANDPGPITLDDSAGTATAITLAKDNWGMGQSGGGSGDNTPLFRGYTDTNPDKHIYGAGNDPTPGVHTLTLSGLNQSYTYDLYLYSSWSWTTGKATFNIGGVDKTMSANNNTLTYVENDNYVVFSGISPDVSGEINVDFSNASNAPFNGLQVGTVVPEPATLGLVGLCGGAILFLRRRSMI